MKYSFKEISECEQKAPNKTDSKNGMFVEFSKKGTRHKHDHIRVELLTKEHSINIRINEIKVYGIRSVFA